MSQLRISFFQEIKRCIIVFINAHHGPYSEPIKSLHIHTLAGVKFHFYSILPVIS